MGLRPITGGGGSPTGSAGGDLGGTYPNPTVTSLVHINGVFVYDNGATLTAATSASFNLNQTGNYKIWRGVICGWAPTTGGGSLYLQFNSDTTSNYVRILTATGSDGTVTATGGTTTKFDLVAGDTLSTESGPNSYFIYDLTITAVNSQTFITATGGFRRQSDSNFTQNNSSCAYIGGVPTSVQVGASQAITGYISLAGATK